MAVAVVWSTVSHFVLGVPYDLIQRGKRKGGQADQDVHDSVRVNVNRLMHISQVAGLIMIAFGCFFLTGLGLIGFYYWVELAQAVFLLAFPLGIVGLISVSSVRKISERNPQGPDLYSALFRHRLLTQIVGMIAIFFTAMFGMYQNLDIVRFL